MRNGTQEELDAAREDATLLPYHVSFKTVGHPQFPDGEIVTRGCRVENGIEIEDAMGDENEVAFKYMDGSDYWYVRADHLEVIHD